MTLANEHQNVVLHEATCSLAFVKRIASMLDLEPVVFNNGDELPFGWHFFLLVGNIRKSDIRKDGFPGFGVPIPDLGLPRLVLGGRHVEFLKPIIIGESYLHRSFISSIVEKETPNGRLAIVKIQHELTSKLDSITALKEVQSYILLEGHKVKSGDIKEAYQIDNLKIKKTIIPDEIQLFQYSALGFNSHKIHLDKDYTINVEGYPNLIVNGGLITLYVTEFLRNELKLEARSILVKHIAPLFCDNTITFVAVNIDQFKWEIKVLDNNNQIAATVEVLVK
jgi:3-methylfumaryl-CoA hydratase